MCLEDCGNRRTRRDFLKSAGVAFGGIAFTSSSWHARTATGEQGGILREPVEFKNGADTIEGYLAHPRGANTYRTVLVLHGNLGVSDDIRHTAARLAEAGFAGLAVSSTSRENDEMAKLPREFVLSNRFIKRYIADAQAGIEFLKQRSLLGGDGFGVIGYCGGGYTAARFAQADPRVKAFVAFYAAPSFPPERNSQADPRPQMSDFIEQVKIPAQFHYGTRDNLIPNADVEKLREKLSSKNRKPEIYLYDEAQHGFANITGETYRADYAALAEKRWRTFLQKHL
jgi:carboxymethylenebutenolidase